jgi:hypothetical protein
MDARKVGLLLLGLALLINLGAAASAAHVDPPANDYLLHGQMITRAAHSLTHEGWTQFQDPWFPELNGGYPLFHHYPHLPHQWTAVAAAVFKADGFAAMAAANFLLVLLLPLAVFVGGRWLGLGRDAAGIAAIVVATARSLDGFGHTPLGYGLSGHGLFGQLWGMAFAALAFPAWLTAVEHSGAGLGRLKPTGRILVAGVLTSLVIRSSLPAAFLVGLCALAASLGAGPLREIPLRMARFSAVAGVAGVLSLGFLIPFAADLGAMNSTILELVPERRDSVGMLRVLGRLGFGHYLGLLWSWMLIAAVVGAAVTWRVRSPVERGLAVALGVSILLLFGRATWGDWVGALPLVGRFHDHRYLLGLHLLAPWGIGAGIAAALPALKRVLEERLGDRFDDRLPTALLLLVVALAALSYLPALTADRRQRAETDEAFEAVRLQLDAVLEQARAVDGPVAWGPEDSMLGGTTRLSWLRRHGVPTFGRPLHHYSFVHDFAGYWTRSAASGAPLVPADLVAAGVARVLPDGPTAPVGARLVRADLVVSAVGSDFQGFPIRWFADGIHLRGQHPVMAPRGQVPTERFQAKIAIEDRDASALLALKPAPELGQVRSRPATDEPDAGGRFTDGPPFRYEVDVLERPAWLLIPVGWHPRWTVTVDGRPATFAMLTPGWLGVALPKTGPSTVEAAWRAAPWRGPWAGANIVLCFLLLLLPWVTRRDF